jgi:membrane fusion protein, heavy metal efflux system
MTHHTRGVVRPAVVLLLAIALVAIGSGATYLLMRRTMKAESVVLQPPPGERARTREIQDANPPTNAPLPDIVLALTKDAVERAGIVVASVTALSDNRRTRVPAVVEPNAYRSVAVTPIVAGRVMSVSVELGQQVRRGQRLAQLYSPELAEVQSQYLAARAKLDAHEREVQRTEKLAQIGSASRQELEGVHAEHTASVAMAQSLRSRLTLLGMTAAEIEKLPSASSVAATVAVPAPIDGAITAREANIGLNVDPATKLFTVVDLSSVWFVGELYERDFSLVRVGSSASITTPAYPELMIEGKVSYIDPEVNPQSRTARVRVEAPNPGRRFRLGMYAQMDILQSRQSAVDDRVVVPRSAVQTVGDRSVIYLADQSEPGRFIEREVQLGSVVGDDVEVARGLQRGDRVVVKGSFSLRAERERLGLRPAASTPVGDAAQTRVTVSEKGFEPARVTVRGGIPVRITFVRTTDATCATEVVIPSQNITRALPLNQPVTIDLTPQKTGEIEFVCGMNMFKGAVVIQ